jgi:predicted ester cyclase
LELLCIILFPANIIKAVISEIFWSASKFCALSASHFLTGGDTKKCPDKFGGDMAENNETLLHRWFEEVWNKGREEAIDEMFAEDGIGHGLPTETGEPIRGPKDFKVLHRAFRQAFPNINVTVEDTVTEGDKVAARCTVKAVHEGEGIGVAPTAQPIEFTGMVIVRLKDGKIVESWNEFNFMKMYSQVGALTLNLQ